MLAVSPPKLYARLSSATGAIHLSSVWGCFSALRSSASALGARVGFALTGARVARVAPGLRSLAIYKASSTRDLQVGDVFKETRCFADPEVRAFLQLTGDNNSIHTSQAAAEAAGFSAPVLPGSLGASLFPAIIGSACEGAVYAQQTLNFKRPAMVGQPVTACLEVTSIKSLRGRRRVAFDTQLLGGVGTDKEVHIDGEAVALIPDASTGTLAAEGATARTEAPP